MQVQKVSLVSGSVLQSRLSKCAGALLVTRTQQPGGLDTGITQKQIVYGAAESEFG